MIGGRDDCMLKKYFCVFGMMFILLAGCSRDVSQVPDMPRETDTSKKTDTSKETDIPPETDMPLKATVSPEADMPDVQNEKAHEAYKLLMEESNDDINHLRKNGMYANPYVFYDIDGDGIDELIVSGGYYAYRVFTYQNGKVIDLWTSKYGGIEICIYPDQGVVFFSSGHMNYYADTYIQITESKVEVVAERSWHVEHLSETKIRTENEYTVMGVSVKKSEYEAYVKSLEKEKVVTHNQLEWENKKI